MVARKFILHPIHYIPITVTEPQLYIVKIWGALLWCTLSSLWSASATKNTSGNIFVTKPLLFKIFWMVIVKKMWKITFWIIYCTVCGIDNVTHTNMDPIRALQCKFIFFLYNYWNQNNGNFSLWTLEMLIAVAVSISNPIL